MNKNDDLYSPHSNLDYEEGYYEQSRFNIVISSSYCIYKTPIKGLCSHVLNPQWTASQSPECKKQYCPISYNKENEEGE